MDDKHPHSQEPWLGEWNEIKAGPYGATVARISWSGGSHAEIKKRIDIVEAKANFRRIVACVNACEGISIEALEDWASRIHQREEIKQTILGALQVALVSATDFADSFSESVTHMTDEEMEKPLGEHTRTPKAILRGRRERVRQIEDAIKVIGEWPND